MHARVTTFQPRLDRTDEGIRFFQDSASDIRNLRGFKEAVLLLDRDSGKAMTITLWESEDALNESGSAAAQVFQRAADYIEGQPSRQTYEVLEHRHGQNRKYARVSTGTVAPEWFQQLGGQQGTSIIDAASRQPGYSGFLVLADRSSNRVMGMSFWDSKEHLKASEGPGGYYQQEMEKSREQWAGGQWLREIYEVATEI